MSEKPHLPTFDQNNTSPIELSKKFRENLKQSHLSYCGVPGNFLSMIATPISFSMSKLFNNLFEKFPDMRKLSHVTYIYKHKGF